MGNEYVMPRFVMRYHGAGPRPEDVVERVRTLPESRIIDDSGRMLLVEAPAAEHLMTAIGKAGFRTQRSTHARTVGPEARRGGCARRLELRATVPKVIS